MVMYNRIWTQRASDHSFTLKHKMIPSTGWRTYYIPHFNNFIIAMSYLANVYETLKVTSKHVVSDSIEFHDLSISNYRPINPLRAISFSSWHIFILTETLTYFMTLPTEQDSYTFIVSFTEATRFTNKKSILHQRNVRYHPTKSKVLISPVPWF